MSKGRNWSKFFFAFALLSLLAACAGKKDIKSNDPTISSAAPIPLDEKSSDDSADSTVFADLNANAQSPSASPAESTDLNNTMAAAPESSPFYNTIGGESLGRVAYTLYGSRKYTPRLLDKNPELKGAKSLSEGLKVYFDFNALNPQPMYLTKGLIENYASELAQHIEESPTAKERETVSLAPGQTLQALSQQLYGTTRYWTEIYLLNHDKLSQGYDKVAAGTQLVVVKRESGLAFTKVKKRKKPEVKSEELKEDEMIAAVAPVAAPVQQPNLPPPSFTPPPAQNNAVAPQPMAQNVKEKTPEPAPIAVNNQPIPAPKVEETSVASPLPQMTTHQESRPQVAKVTTSSPQEGLFSSANMRRAIYVTLIITIAFAAYYVTRPGKKTSFDMLDMTTHASSSVPPPRPKLADRDDSSQNAG